MKKYLKISIFNVALLTFAFLLFAYTFLSATFLKPTDTYAADAAVETTAEVQVKATAAVNLNCATAVGTGYTQTSVTGLCGTVPACVNTATAKTGECDFMGSAARDCGNIKGAPAAGFTWSCYQNRCVQEESKSCLIKSGNSCISCGCTETSAAAIAAKTAQCVNGATSYTTRCTNCGNSVSYACPKTYTCNVCDKTNPNNWVVKTTAGANPCDEVTSFTDKAKAIALCTPPTPVTYTCNLCDKTNPNNWVIKTTTSTTKCDEVTSFADKTKAEALCTPPVTYTCNLCDKTNPNNWVIKTTTSTTKCDEVTSFADKTKAVALCTPVVYNCNYCDKTTWTVTSETSTTACKTGNYPTKEEAVKACVKPNLDLTISKVVDNPIVEKDAKPVFTISVSNDGNVSVPGPIVIDDVLPKGLTFISAASVGDVWTCTSTAAANGDTNLKCKTPAAIDVAKKAVDIKITTQATEYDKSYTNKVDTYSESVPNGSAGETNPNNNHAEATVKTNPQPELPLACTTNPSSPTGILTVGGHFDVSLGSASNAKTPGTLVSDTPTICKVSGNTLNFVAAGVCKYHVEWSKGDGNIKPDQVSCPGTGFTIVNPIIPGVSITKEMNSSGANFANYTVKVANTGNVALKSIGLNDYFDSEHLQIDSIKIGDVNAAYDLVDQSNATKKSTKIVFKNLADIPAGGVMTISLNLKVIGEVEVATLACNTKVEVNASYIDYFGTSKVLNDSYVNPMTNTLCVTIPAIKYDNMYLNVNKTNVTGATVRIGTQEKPTQVSWVVKVQAVCSGRCKPLTKISYNDTFPNDYLYLQDLTMQKFNSDGTAASDVVEIYKGGVQKLTLTTISANVDPTTRNLSLQIDNLLISTLNGTMTPGQYIELKMLTDTKKVGNNIVNTVVATGPNDHPQASAIVNVESKESVIGISVEALPDTSGFSISFLDFSNPANQVAFTIAIIAMVFGLGATGLMIIEKKRVPFFLDKRVY